MLAPTYAGPLQCTGAVFSLTSQLHLEFPRPLMPHLYTYILNTYTRANTFSSPNRLPSHFKSQFQCQLPGSLPWLPTPPPPATTDQEPFTQDHTFLGTCLTIYNQISMHQTVGATSDTHSWTKAPEGRVFAPETPPSQQWISIVR